MSGLIDGVNTIFTVEHKRTAMHFDAFKNRRAMIETLLGQTPVEEEPEDIVRWLESLKAKIDANILNIKQVWELDGHKRPHDPEYCECPHHAECAEAGECLIAMRASPSTKGPL